MSGSTSVRLQSGSRPSSPCDDETDKFMSNVAVLREGDLIEFKSSKNFINEVSKVTPANGSAKIASSAAPKTSETKEAPKDESRPDNRVPSSAPQKEEPKSDRDALLKCLKDAVQITEQVDSARFSTQDIIKLALTLFIHRTA